MLRMTLMLLLTGVMSVGAAMQSDRFAEADTDSNGVVTEAELRAYATVRLPQFKQVAELLKRLDKDGDGRLDKTEFAGRQQAALALMQQARADEEAARTQEPVEFAERYEQMFARRKPSIGDVVPDVVAFDENGKPFQLNSTRGKYTVLVFGCLT